MTQDPASLRTILQDTINRNDLDGFRDVLQSLPICSLDQFDLVYDLSCEIVWRAPNGGASECAQYLEEYIAQQLRAKINEHKDQCPQYVQSILTSHVANLLAHTSDPSWVDVLEDVLDFKTVFSDERIYILDQVIGNSNAVIFKKLFDHQYITSEDLLKGSVNSFLHENIECNWKDAQWFDVLHNIGLSKKDTDELMKNLFAWSVRVNNTAWMDRFASDPSLVGEYVSSLHWVHSSLDGVVEQHTYFFNHDVWAQYLDHNQFLEHVFDLAPEFFAHPPMCSDQEQDRIISFLVEQFSVWERKHQDFEHHINRAIHHPLWVEFLEQLLKTFPTDEQIDIVSSCDPEKIDLLPGYIQQIYINHALPNGTARQPKKM